MLRRALSLAAAMLWVSMSGPAGAQNLEAGKTPAQIFAATCAVCHKGPHGLLKSVAPGSLPGFLRQHYTTSTSMASAMSAYVLSNGAANRRAGDDLTREGRESRTAPKPSAPESEPRQERRFGGETPASRPAAKPREDGAGQADTPEKKPKAEKRKPRHVPPKDEPKDTSRPASDTVAKPKPEAPAAESSKPAAVPEKPSDSAAQPSAPETPVKKPDEEKPAAPSNMPVFNIEPKPESKSDAPAAPAPTEPAAPISR